MERVDQAARLDGRSALVTEGSRGIGRGIAMELAAAGAAVAVNYRRNADAADAVVRVIREAGGRAEGIRASVDRLAETAQERLGPIDLLVCNAGIASRGLAVADTDIEEFVGLMATHTLSAVRLVQRLLPGMRTQARGDVIFISSSEVGLMRPCAAPYTMSNSALEALALTLAKEEVTHGIRVNVVAPGLVVTDMGSRLVRATLGVDDITQLDAQQPLGRVTRPQDIGRVVRFLASADASHVTGQRVVVDGGAGHA